METSKKLLIFSILLACIITSVTIVAVFYLKEITPLEFLIPSVFGLTSTAFGFYYWKAKNENISKYGNNVEEDYEDCT